MPGATQRATRSPVVDSFAPIVMLTAVTMAMRAIQPPMSQDDLIVAFMISTFLWTWSACMVRLDVNRRGAKRLPIDGRSGPVGAHP